MQIQKISSNSQTFQARLNKNMFDCSKLQNSAKDVFVKENPAKVSKTLFGSIIGTFTAGIVNLISPQDKIKSSAELTQEEIEELRAKVKENPDFQSFNLNADELCAEQIILSDRILNDKKVLNNENIRSNIKNIVCSTKTEEHLNIVDKILSNKMLCKNSELFENLRYVMPRMKTPEHITIMNEILDNRVLRRNNYVATKFSQTIHFFNTPDSGKILNSIFQDKKLRNNKNIMEHLPNILAYTYNKNALKIAEKILQDKNINKNPDIMKVLTTHASDANSEYRADVMSKVINKLFDNKDIYNKPLFAQEFDEILKEVKTHKKYQVFEKAYSDENLYKRCNVYNLMTLFMSIDTQENADLACQLLEDENPSLSSIGMIVFQSKLFNRKEYVYDLCKNYKKMDLNQDEVSFLCANNLKITPEQIRKLNNIAGRENVSKLVYSDRALAYQIADMCGKKNINEIPEDCKRELLRALVKSDIGVVINPRMRSMFPLLPRSPEEYCTLLPAIVNSMSITTKTLNPEDVEQFNKSLLGLSDVLKNLTDKEFAELKITQEYPKEEFIRNIQIFLKYIPSEYQQQVYDYYGFELHENPASKSGVSITGYPANTQKEDTLKNMSDGMTQLINLVRQDVIRFTENNHIFCNNKEVERFLNDTFKYLPELHTAVGKIQHPTHSFDILQHSLKVMQKIAQNPEFSNLNNSDKRLIMLAALLHDIAKGEGIIDKTHAQFGAFDAFHITKKFGLTREEEIKLFKLIKHHEWLAYVNKVDDYKLNHRLQSVAFDLQDDNLFDLSLMFTHADLKAVKTTDDFHDKSRSSRSVDYVQMTKSYGDWADFFAKIIKPYIHQLQATQPFLPVTKFPKASRIEDAITYVMSDGSTNIKGVYKDSDGLVVIKFNEVEDWESIGFPKGSSTKGIITTGLDEKRNEINVETGNIKFFVHALDLDGQLTKFDAFSMPDSDALLSLSYAERPETKYRFFRAQGIILDFNSKYIYGGGDNDAGSGVQKTIKKFKENYIFNGIRRSERVYVPNLIKQATGMNDDEYIKFINANKNKSFTEIEPVELREKIIKALATINSNPRKGNRAYNEMYGSNPERVMGVFAYNMDIDEKTENPIEFLHRDTVEKCDTTFNQKTTKQRTEFLRKYAVEHDIPFILFGN